MPVRRELRDRQHKRQRGCGKHCSEMLVAVEVTDAGFGSEQLDNRGEGVVGSCNTSMGIDRYRSVLSNGVVLNWMRR